MRHCRDFIRLNHWHYGNRIIKTAETVAQTNGLFPLYVTAFKCAPDSFIIEYFKAIMDYYRKPYLILQLDEHEAAEGYDTRLEAAVETFHLFRGTHKQPHRPAITLKSAFEKKTYLLPGYDLLSAHLMQGAFTHAGIKAMVVEQTPDTISQSLRINDGQCLPVSILTQGIRHTIQSHGLDPEQAAFFCNSEAELAYNLPQYPVMIKQGLERMGNGINLLVEKHFQSQWEDGRYINLLRDKVAYTTLTLFNRKISAIAQPVLHDRPCGLGHDPLYYLQKHAFTIRHGGETSENLLKVYYLKERYPGLRLIINVNPIFCCPGLNSEAIYKKVEKEIGIPIVSITYDGTQADKNRVLNPYLYFLK